MNSWVIGHCMCTYMYIYIQIYEDTLLCILYLADLPYKLNMQFPIYCPYWCICAHTCISYTYLYINKKVYVFNNKHIYIYVHTWLDIYVYISFHRFPNRFRWFPYRFLLHTVQKNPFGFYLIICLFPALPYLQIAFGCIPIRSTLFSNVHHMHSLLEIALIVDLCTYIYIYVYVLF